MLALTRKFTLRLAADLWWTIYVGMAGYLPAPDIPGQRHASL